MTDQLAEGVTYETADGVAIIHLDDGKANALGHASIGAIHTSLDRAADEAGAVAVIGRPGRFCAGFDLDVMRSDDPEAPRGLLEAGCKLWHRMFLHPQPIVIACTGHALAAGAITLFCGDVRVGEEGTFKIGMNEVAIGMPLPKFAVELARDRLSKRHFGAATQLARIYEPAEAVDAGFLDTLVGAGQSGDSAVTMAAELASGLHRTAFAMTRTSARAEVAATALAALDGDLATFAVTG